MMNIVKKILNQKSLGYEHKNGNKMERGMVKYIDMFILLKKSYPLGYEEKNADKMER